MRKKMKPKSNEYIKGFRHGVKWACTMGFVSLREIEYVSMKEAIKSLRKGR